MKGIILLNGEPYNSNIPKKDGDFTVCCDGAYNWAKGKIEIDLVLGDFDSLKIPPEGALIYPAQKDKTDGEIAALYLLSKGCKEIEIYGGGGLREDHFLGNLSLLYLISKRGAAAEMINNKSIITLVKGRYAASAKAGDILSVVPFTDKVHINESVGLQYSLKGLTLYKWSTRGISNVLTKDNFYIDVGNGTALIILNKEL